MNSPAQVDVGASDSKVGIESTNCAKQISSHQDTCTGQGKYVLHRIVLFLVEFAVFCDCKRHTEPVNGHPDALDHGGLIPVHKLWSDSTSIRSIQLINKTAHCIWIQGHVIVHEAEKATVALHQFQDAVARRPVSGVPSKKADNGCR
jgi:hypothetical protein